MQISSRVEAEQENGLLSLGLLFHFLLSQVVAKVIYSLESCDHPTRSSKSSWWGLLIYHRQ